jgi:hypothetical protein
MTIDPVLVVSAITTILTGVASGTVHLTEMIPERYVKPVMGWAGFFAFANSSVLTVIYGVKNLGPATLPPAVERFLPLFWG